MFSSGYSHDFVLFLSTRIDDREIIRSLLLQNFCLISHDYFNFEIFFHSMTYYTPFHKNMISVGIRSG